MSKLYMYQESTLTVKLKLQKTTISGFQHKQDTRQVEMTFFIPWVSLREVQVNHLAPELTLAGGRTGLRPARWKSTRISLKTEWGTGGLLTKELEVLSGLLHPNILLLMATTSGPDNSLQLIFEQVAHGSLYQCLHQRPIMPNLALLLNRVDVLLQVRLVLS